MQTGRGSLLLLILMVAAGVAGCARNPAPAAEPAQKNVLAMAVAWKETAAEYDALYYQGFNVARARVEDALEHRKRLGTSPANHPLIVISDLDDTVLDTRDYWREALAAGAEFFDDALWDQWVAKNRVRPSPGALEFLNFCRDSGVEVFYITNRDQGPKTTALALGHLQAAGLPFADADHLTVLTESSDKEPRQRELARDHEVVVYLGDNLNDFRRNYYLTDDDDRRQQLSADRDAFGRRFILFPNPTDGHWVRAILGDSEPPPTPENLSRLHRLIGGR